MPGHDVDAARGDDAVAPARATTIPRATIVPFALATTALFLFQLGYVFEVGDQLQYLLLPYRELVPNFLPDDWFTWHTSHYHRTFAWLVETIWALCGETGFPRGMFVAQLLNLAALGCAIWRLAMALELGLFEAGFCVVMFAGVRQIGLAGAVVNHASLVPADLALAPFLLACAALAEGRVLALGVWLGVAGFLHANYALLGPAVLFPLLGLRLRGDLQPSAAGRRAMLLRLLMATGLFGLIAAPTLWLVFTSFLVHDAAPQAVAVTLFVRSPHHYDLASMRPDEFYYAGLLGLIALPRFWSPVGARKERATPNAADPAHWLLARAQTERASLDSARTAASASTRARRQPPGRDLDPKRRVHLQLCAAMLIALAVGLVGSGLHVLSLARLFTWRMSIPLFTLLLMAAGKVGRDCVVRRDWLGLTCWLGGIAAALSFAQTDPLEGSPWTTSPLPAAGAGCAYLLATAALFARPRLRAIAVPLGSLLGALIAWSVVLTSLWVAKPELHIRPRGLHWFDARIELLPPVRALHALVRERTPQTARFLIPPGQSSFRLEARRSVFVDWKCTPMKGDEALEWQRRMLLAMGADAFPAIGYALPRAADAAYNARPLRELSLLARTENMTHVLARNRRESEPTLHPLFSSGGYTIYELR
jgi:hypothetical protein